MRLTRRLFSLSQSVAIHTVVGNTIMAKDGNGWKRMEKDGKGWKRMEKDGKGWKRMEKDGKGWKRMEKDGKGWKRMEKPRFNHLTNEATEKRSA
jgi:hypothetical protein